MFDKIDVGCVAIPTDITRLQAAGFCQIANCTLCTLEEGLASASTFQAEIAIERVTDGDGHDTSVCFDFLHQRKPKLSCVEDLQTNAVPVSLQPVRQSSSRSLRLGQRSCMQRDDHPILVEPIAHISRDTAREAEDAITADKIGVILDHSLAHTS